MTNQVNDALRR